MIAASFFGGVIVGAAILILVALYLSQRDKPDAGPQHNGIAATSVSLNGNSASMESHHAKMLENVLRSASDHKLYERLRH
jgi:hypothetical protein